METLQERIAGSGMYPREIAERLGVSLSRVAKWAQGQRTPCCIHMARELDKVLKSKRPSKKAFRKIG